MSPTRRSLVRAGLGLAAAGAMAGCSGGDDDGESGTDTPPTTAEPRIVANEDADVGIDRIRFAASRPGGYREFDALDPESIDPGLSRVYVYIEPSGVPVIETPEGDRSVRVRLRLRVLGPGGSAVYDRAETIEQPIPPGSEPETLYFTVFFPPPNDPAGGEYTAEVTVSDRVVGGEATGTAPFLFGSGESGGSNGSEFLERYRTEARSYGIDVTAVAVNEGRLEVQYDTTAQTDSRRFGEEIGFLGGLYAGIVGRGWEAGPLVAVVNVEGGSRYRWHVDRGTALEYAADELGDEEFVRVLLESVEEV